MEKNLIILSEVRSGSTYIAELISYNIYKCLGIELWDLAREHFQSLTHASTADEVARLLDELWINPQQFRCFGLKCGQLSALFHAIADAPELQTRILGGDTRCLIVRRRDRIMQAVSLNCARCRGVFHTYQDLPACDPCIGRHEDIQAALQMINLSDLYLDECASRFKNVMTVWYEEVTEEPIQFLKKYAKFCNIHDDLPLEKDAMEVPKVRRSFTNRKMELSILFRNYFVKSYHDYGDGQID